MKQAIGTAYLGEDIERMIEGRIIEDCEAHLVGDFDSGSCTPPAALSATQSVDTLSIALLKALSDFTSSQAEGKLAERFTEKESEAVEATAAAAVAAPVADAVSIAKTAAVANIAAVADADANAGDLIVIKSNSLVAVEEKMTVPVIDPLKDQKELKSLEPLLSSDGEKKSLSIPEEAEAETGVEVSTDLVKSKSMPVTDTINEDVIEKRYLFISRIC